MDQEQHTSGDTSGENLSDNTTAADNSQLTEELNDLNVSTPHHDDQPTKDQSNVETTSITSSSADSATVSANSDGASLSRSSSTNSSQKDLITSNCGSSSSPSHVAKATASAERKPSATGSTGSSNTASSGSGSKSKLKNPFSIFRRKSSSHDNNNKSPEQMEANLNKRLSEVKVETLPQLFVTKYLGFKTTRGLYGVKYTREPLEQLLAEVSEPDRKDQLPLMQLHVSIRGIHVSEHKSNTVKSVPIDSGLVPIEFISFGVQDINYSRIFTFIIVREMSSRARKLECHAYMCESSVTARKLALSMALAFEQYAKTLEGKPHKFQVALRSGENGAAKPDDTSGGGDVTNGDSIAADCEAWDWECCVLSSIDSRHMWRDRLDETVWCCVNVVMFYCSRCIDIVYGFIDI